MNPYLTIYLVGVFAMIIYASTRAYYETLLDKVSPYKDKFRFGIGNILIATKPHPDHGDRSYMRTPIKVVEKREHHIVYQAMYSLTDFDMLNDTEPRIMLLDEAISQKFIHYIFNKGEC